MGTSAVRAQTVDDVVAQNIKARGFEKWRTVQTIKVTADITIQGQSARTTVWQKRPSEMRQELRIGGTTLVQAYDGTTAWAINPQLFNGSLDPHELSGQEAATIKDQAEFESVLFDYKAKGHTVELIGKEQIENADVFHLKVTKANGQIQQFFIDAKTGLERRVVSSVTQAGQTVELTSEPGNFKDVNGIQMPFSVTQSVAGLPAVQLTVHSIEFNVPVDEAMFRMPKASRGFASARSPGRRR